VKLGLYVAPFGPLAHAKALEIVTALWTGEPVTHAGPGWTLDRAQVLPTLTSAERPDARRRAELESAGSWWLQGFGDRPALDEVDAAAAAGPPQ
jgi:alkanesulfonate monooxygenase SsuD/methylene tetrahydromethanopterin reductase-like flavin-dependent oxidoreductase (luciferase family)